MVEDRLQQARDPTTRRDPATSASASAGLNRSQAAAIPNRSQAAAHPKGRFASWDPVDLCRWMHALLAADNLALGDREPTRGDIDLDHAARARSRPDLGGSLDLTCARFPLSSKSLLRTLPTGSLATCRILWDAGIPRSRGACGRAVWPALHAAWIGDLAAELPPLKWSQV